MLVQIILVKSGFFFDLTLIISYKMFVTHSLAVLAQFKDLIFNVAIHLSDLNS